MGKTLVRIDSLSDGDAFWYRDRGWVVRNVLPDGVRRCECLDDGGEPELPGYIVVEALAGGEGE